jgi:adenosylhomocysteine nucleosidase
LAATRREAGLMIAVTFALPAESSAFLSRVSGKTNVTRDGITTVYGRIETNEVEILHTGVGQSTCQRRIERFLRGQDFKFLISSGFAGAVTEDFKTGDLILGENFSEPQLLQTAKHMLHGRAVQAGKLSTAPAMIDSDADRAALRGATGAAAVDMETEWIAAACGPRCIPLLSLRVISDTPSEPLPAPAKVLFDIQRQRTPFFRLAEYAVIHPSVITRLLRFQRRIARARAALAEAITVVISQL